ncbi:hypothetical protein BD289DRAFT_105953 [Coniella lustricola]|uniref:Uncharacterized protein n=1 Tax=Coniella lustricola TaxID=2025994 RepID=A0A2T2ZXM2_9PEZI|nr:hypothetical protein BD289DRAFT_105953 [Coniella lustricola]
MVPRRPPHGAWLNRGRRPGRSFAARSMATTTSRRTSLGVTSVRPQHASTPAHCSSPRATPGCFGPLLSRHMSRGVADPPSWNGRWLLAAATTATGLSKLESKTLWSVTRQLTATEMALSLACHCPPFVPPRDKMSSYNGQGPCFNRAIVPPSKEPGNPSSDAGSPRATKGGCIVTLEWAWHSWALLLLSLYRVPLPVIRIPHPQGPKMHWRSWRAPHLGCGRSGPTPLPFD